MPRVTRADLVEIEDLRAERRKLEAREKELKRRLEAAGLTADTPLSRGDKEAVLVEYSGQPDVKKAYIKLAGERAYKRLRRPTHHRLEIRER